MQFKINNINIKISFSFFALIILLICFNKTDILLISIISAITHELGHLIALIVFKINILEISFSILGGNIKKEIFNKTNYKQDVLIYFSGPLFNLIIGIIFYILFNCSHINLLYNLFLINIFLFIFNLLPFYNFDGGKIIISLLKLKLDEKTAENILAIISILVLVPFAYYSIFIFFNNNANFHLLLISGYMLLAFFLGYVKK